MHAGTPLTGWQSSPPKRNCEVVKHTATSVVTIDRFIIEQEKLHPEATGELSRLLYDLALAAKMIANKVRSAGLADILGATDLENVQGETQQKLDVLANEIIVKAVDHGGQLCAMASEEEPGIIDIPPNFRCGKYCLLFDPLDGSSNIDVNVPVGTIFSVVKKITRGSRGEMEDMLQPGTAAGGVGLRHLRLEHDARLHHRSGCARLYARSFARRVPAVTPQHPDARMSGRYLSVNDSYHSQWETPVQSLMSYYRGQDGNRQPMSTRYVGSLVADFHRNLLGGGLFAYPANRKNKRGKLRLLYEANPLAFIVEQAGGAATDGEHAFSTSSPLSCTSGHRSSSAARTTSMPRARC